MKCERVPVAAVHQIHRTRQSSHSDEVTEVGSGREEKPTPYRAPAVCRARSSQSSLHPAVILVYSYGKGDDLYIYTTKILTLKSKKGIRF